MPPVSSRTISRSAPRTRSSRSGLASASVGDDPHRAQVREQLEALAQAQQALLRARRVRVGRVPLRPAHGAQQHRVRRRGIAPAPRGAAARRARRSRCRRRAAPSISKAGVVHRTRARRRSCSAAPMTSGPMPSPGRTTIRMAAVYGPPAAASSWACSTWSTRSLSSREVLLQARDVLCLLLLVVGDLLQLVLDLGELRLDVACPDCLVGRGRLALELVDVALQLVTSSRRRRCRASLSALSRASSATNSAMMPEDRRQHRGRGAELRPEARAVDLLGQLGVEVDLALGRDHLALDGGAERARGLRSAASPGRRLMRRRRWLLHRGQPTPMW